MELRPIWPLEPLPQHKVALVFVIPQEWLAPTERAVAARNAAVEHLVKTFFGGSAEEAAVALLEMSDTKIPRDVIERLARSIQSARKEGR